MHLGHPNLFDGLPDQMAASEQLAAHIPDLAVRQATVIFGESALVPLRPGDPVTFEELLARPLPERRQQLAAHSIGVICGTGPEPIGVLTLPPRIQSPFIIANPVLCETCTMLSSGTGETASFVRSFGLPLDSRQGPAGVQWISGGQVLPVFDRTAPDRIVCARQLKVKKFHLSRWDWQHLPDFGLELAITEVARQHGAELLPGKHRPMLNPAFWAAWYLAQTGTRYDPTLRTFFTANEEANVVTEAIILSDLARLLLAWSQRPSCQGLLYFREPGHLRRILAQMKIFGAQIPTTTKAGINDFLVRRVVADPGATLTVAELYQAYCAHSSQLHVPPAPEIAFAKVSAVQLGILFQVTKCHSIMRHDKARRGFRHIRLLPTA